MAGLRLHEYRRDAGRSRRGQRRVSEPVPRSEPLPHIRPDKCLPREAGELRWVERRTEHRMTEAIDSGAWWRLAADCSSSADAAGSPSGTVLRPARLFGVVNSLRTNACFTWSRLSEARRPASADRGAHHGGGPSRARPSSCVVLPRTSNDCPPPRHSPCPEGGMVAIGPTEKL